MLCAFRPSPTCVSIQSRYGSQADAAAVTGAGGQGGGVCSGSPTEPVATPGEFAATAYRRIVLRSTPVRRSISRWLAPLASNVWMVIRKCCFKTFTPGSLGCRGISVTSRQIRPTQRARAASNPARLEEFGVATSGGVWVAAGEL